MKSAAAENTTSQKACSEVIRAIWNSCVQAVMASGKHPLEKTPPGEKAWPKRRPAGLRVLTEEAQIICHSGVRGRCIPRLRFLPELRDYAECL